MTSFRQSAFPPPPQAAQVPHRTSDGRDDPWAWLRDPGYPEVADAQVLAHLTAENAYAEAVLGSAPDLRETLFQELKARVVEDDSSVPVRDGPFDYWRRFRPGQQYRVHCRRVPGGPDQVTLDLNELAAGHSYFSAAAVVPSPDHRLLAYATDTDGSERWTIRVKRLDDGALLDDCLVEAGGSVVWDPAGGAFFYLKLDEHQRPKTVLRHRLGTAPAEDAVVYDEADPRFFVSIDRSLDRRVILIHAGSKSVSEVWALGPDGLVLLAPRRDGHEYDADHWNGGFVIRTNDRHPNFRLVTTADAAAGEAGWTELLAGSDERYIEGHLSFTRAVAVLERAGGLRRIRMIGTDGEQRLVEFPDAAYSVVPLDNVDAAAPALRLQYESPVTPPTVFDCDLETLALTARKVTEVPGGFDPKAYRVERLAVTARDGQARIPVTVVARRDRLPGGPLYLYGYGAYGAGIDPGFRSDRLSLLDRGFAIAIAHVRGGDELGRAWYDAGKLEHKMNSFTDFIDVADGLATAGWTRAGDIVASGGSAGGLLVGAVANLAPDRFRAVVAKVPFVDALSTMLDTTLPLTTVEFDEWGDPADPAVHARIAGYSPYDNVRAQAYPHLFVTAGLTDPRVTYWEPAKWAAKLRALKTDDHVLVLKTDMTAGHGGPQGRYERLREIAWEYAFLCRAFGVT